MNKNSSKALKTRSKVFRAIVVSCLEVLYFFRLLVIIKEWSNTVKGKIGSSCTTITAAQLAMGGHGTAVQFSAPRKKRNESWEDYLQKHWPVAASKWKQAWRDGSTVSSMKLKGPFRSIIRQCWSEWDALKEAEQN